MAARVSYPVGTHRRGVRLERSSLHFSPPFVRRRREDLLLQPERIEAKIDGAK